MIPINVDTSGLAVEFGLSKEQIQQLITDVITGITKRAAKRWELVASQELGSVRDMYVKSLIVGSEGPYIGYVMLVSKNPLPLMIELGTSAFDMKEGFGKSQKIKIKKGGGWYLTIPFRFATAGALGENQIFSGKLPKKIDKLVKNLAPEQSLKIKDIPKEFQTLKTREKLLTPNKEFETYTHRTSIYEGIQKTKLPGSNRHTQYINFRRVSDKSDANSWIHPGFIAKNFKDKAIKSMDLFKEIDELVEEFLEKEGYGK
jgi:hypothetical protein